MTSWTMPTILRRRICIAILCGACPLLWAETPPAAARSYPIRGKMWLEPDLRAAYLKVRQLYAVDPGSRRIVTAGEQRAFPLQGKVRDRVRAGRLIVESADGRLVAVQCDGLTAADADGQLDLMVCANGTPWLSYESSADNRRSLPFYQDVTLSFEEFVTSLQRGQHYPEAPELGTHAGRKGLFRTERVQGNVIEDP